MSLILKDIYNQTKHTYRLNLIAGEKGLDRIMNWVYVSEDLGNADFIQGGELVITTGICTEFTSGWLHEFVKVMIQHNTSGMIINTGKYIQANDISQDIIDMCDEYNYSLFTMPWNIHIYDITRDYCNRIFSYNQAGQIIENALASVINRDDDYARSIDILERNSYDIQNSYRVCIINESDNNCIPSGLRFILDNIIKNADVVCNVLCLNKQFVLIYGNTACDDIIYISERIRTSIADYYGKKSSDIVLGIGGEVNTLDNIRKSYVQAERAVRMAQFNNAGSYNYDDCGIYKVLFSVEDMDVIHEYIDEKLHDIKEYDRVHNSNMSDTLRSYIRNKGSIQNVAQELYCHRNTINNRMHIIRESIITNLDDPVNMSEIMMAYIMEMYCNQFM